MANSEAKQEAIRMTGLDTAAGVRDHGRVVGPPVHDRGGDHHMCRSVQNPLYELELA